MSIRFGFLSSGSCGNALLLVTPSAKVLIDAGMSFRQLDLRANAMGIDLRGLNAVFVTHEHRDHVSGVGVFARKTGVPVYITPKTFEALPPEVGLIPKTVFFEAGERISIDGLTLTSFSVCHDAADPVSFVAEAEDARLGVASDLGRVSQLVKTRLAGSHGLVLESNYCPDMLERGSYPPALKQRIRGSLGHLSNNDMNTLLGGLLHESLQVVILTHLSKDNNTPERARDQAARVLRGHPAKLHVALRGQATPLFEIRA